MKNVENSEENIHVDIEANIELVVEILTSNTVGHRFDSSH